MTAVPFDVVSMGEEVFFPGLAKIGRVIDITSYNGNRHSIKVLLPYGREVEYRRVTWYATTRDGIPPTMRGKVDLSPDFSGAPPVPTVRNREDSLIAQDVVSKPTPISRPATKKPPFARNSRRVNSHPTVRVNHPTTKIPIPGPPVPKPKYGIWTKERLNQ